MSNLDPIESVGNVVKPPHQAVQSTPLLVLFEHRVSNLEGELETVDTSVVDSLTEVLFAKESMEADNHECQVIEKTSYVLPPRTTRGIPPKRYDPDYDARRSRYPIESPSEGNICHRVPWRSMQHCMQTKFQALLKKPLYPMIGKRL